MAQDQQTTHRQGLKHQHENDQVATLITKTFGSLAFLLFFLLFIIIWICLNTGLFPFVKAFDPFPFPELEMGVCVFSIFLSVMVLISQKRQARIEKIRQEVEFEVNVRSEKEITKMLEMLHRIEKKLGIQDSDKELEEMKGQTDVEELHQKAKKA